MEKYGSGLCCLLLVLVSCIVTSSVSGQADDYFLNDKERKVRLLAHHALFLQLAAESNDCGKALHSLLSTEYTRCSGSE